MIFDLDLHPAVAGEIGPLKAVRRIGAVGAGHEPLRVLDDPAGIDAHMIGNHVASQSDPVGEGAVTQVAVGLFPTQISGNVIAIEGIGRGYSVVIAAELLDGLRGRASFPDAY